MLIQTNESSSDLLDNVFKTGLFGDVKYSSIIGRNSQFIVFEDYTFANGNYMTISIIIEDKEEYRLIHFVEGGSARGIFRFDWGAGHKRKQRLLKALKENGISYKILEE